MQCCDDTGARCALSGRPSESDAGRAQQGRALPPSGEQHFSPALHSAPLRPLSSAQVRGRQLLPIRGGDTVRARSRAVRGMGAPRTLASPWLAHHRDAQGSSLMTSAQAKRLGERALTFGAPRHGPGREERERVCLQHPPWGSHMPSRQPQLLCEPPDFDVPGKVGMWQQGEGQLGAYCGAARWQLTLQPPPASAHPSLPLLSGSWPCLQRAPRCDS